MERNPDVFIAAHGLSLVVASRGSSLVAVQELLIAMAFLVATPVFLPGESQGRGSLVGCRLWGHTESDTTEVT